MTTKASYELQIGDTVTTVWGVELDQPMTVTNIKSVSFNGQTKPVMVYFGGGRAIPVRDNDHRPIVVA